MKLFRWTLIVGLLLAGLTASPAHAAEAQKTGYLPLLHNSSTRFENARAYQALLPMLIRAQQQGEIVEFAPELNVGLVKIVYNNPDSALLGRMSLFADSKSALDSMKPANEAGPGGESVSYNPQFAFDLYGSCFTIQNLIPYAEVDTKSYNLEGKEEGFDFSRADATGKINSCMDGMEGFKPNHKLVYTIYIRDGITRQKKDSFSLKIPTADVKAIDKAKAAFSGVAPAGKPFTATWSQPDFNETQTNSIKTVSGTTQSTGAWSVDFGDVPFRGGAQLELKVDLNSRFAMLREVFAPYVSCAILNNYCFVNGVPNKPVVLEYSVNGKVYTFKGRLNLGGFFTFALLDDQQNAILVRPGHQLLATDVAKFTIPNLTSVVDIDKNLVYGKAQPKTLVEIDMLVYDGGYQSLSFLVPVNSEGAYKKDFTGQLKFQNLLILITYQINKTTGNLISYDPVLALP